ncbi:MAG: dienelactone hydrolase family protein [Acidobacteriota bacterium]|nr:dienelactone hydrolase family protein [Acidobacteriota bacterium]
MCLEDCGNKRTRRDFLAAAGAVIGGTALVSTLLAQTKNGDKSEKVERQFVDFKNGADTINGYLAHPKKKGKYRTVLVLHGNVGVSEDIRHTAVRLAEAGYIGLAVSSTSREEDDMSKLPREFVSSNRFINRYIEDAQAGVEFLKSKSFYNDKGFGVLGYCGGGYAAARFALADSRVKAVVALYAAPVFPPERNSPADPRPAMLEFAEQIKIPMQFHYGTNDGLIPNEVVRKLREKLTEKRMKAEFFIYDQAQHGFANIGGETYRVDYAELAEKRWRAFLRNNLK